MIRIIISLLAFSSSLLAECSDLDSLDCLEYPDFCSWNQEIGECQDISSDTSIFDYDCCSEQPHCYNAFVHPETRQLLTIDDVDVLFSYVSSIGYTVDYNLTKIMMKNKKKDSDFLFFITK